MKESIKKVLSVVFISILALSSAGPLVGPGSAVVEQRLPEQTPQDCITSPPREVTPTGEADVKGIVRQNSSSPVRVEIEYNQVQPGSYPTVHLPYGANLVRQEGFDQGTFSSGLFWNKTADEHLIVYDMSKHDQVEFPHGDSWILTGAPEHTNGNVHLEPQSEGYVGSNIIYIGKYSEKTATIGCQEFKAIVPNDSPPFIRVEQRLEELKVAASSLPTGNKYSTVRIFVSPKNLGKASGFNVHFQNEFVVAARSSHDPSVVWIHEYVHSLQGYRPQPDLTWFYEASATYLSLRVAVENEFISPREYDSYLAQGESMYGNRSLSESAHEQITYNRGAIVLATVENNLSAQSNLTIAHTLAHLNTVRNPGYNDFEAYLQNEGNLSREELNQTRRAVVETDRVQPLYLLGPDLPPDARIVLASISGFPLRLMSTFSLLCMIIAYGYEQLFRDAD